ncbi:hypothetical protein Sjap_023399 [Stephania japonica]|uniref:Cystinosin n=1 Tax=Stephania japonica TaxID=461633 RepID=A0AAP0HMM7_9MAGN
MSSWHSLPLQISYQVLGWLAFFAWSFSFYPQVILNYRRKSPIIQRQYREKYGKDEMIPVAANDVAFSCHAVLLTAITLVQVLIYEDVNVCCTAWESKGLKDMYWDFIISVGCSGNLRIHCFATSFVALADLYLQAFMNFKRKSTEGWSIGNILLDLTGGVANYLQMAMQSIDQDSWVNFYGNIGKTLLSLVSVFFDLLFIVQHYILYPSKKANNSPTVGSEGKSPLLKSVDVAQDESV